MTVDEKYMRYALQLARRGGVGVRTNPNVGAVVVYKDRIIGEGFHQIYGQAHAEVNAIDSVKAEDRCFLAESTIYVTLEPCCHTGKTPPCTEKIINNDIRKVVIGAQDPFPKVNGEGINFLRNNGAEVVVGVLEDECLDLIKDFIVYNTQKRPYVIFKWAQTLDGYIDSDRSDDEPAVWLTGKRCKQLVHKWRTEINAIMVGGSTVKRDNPRLNVREWVGKSPLKVTIDRKGVLTPEKDFFLPDAECVVFTGGDAPFVKEGVEHVKLDFSQSDVLESILESLYERKVKTLMVEGGTTLFNLFLEQGAIDEARIFTSKMLLSELAGGENMKGVKAPVLPKPASVKYEIIDDVTLKLCYYKTN